MNQVELLCPVGDFDCLKAAVQNGADCVYFGVNEFNARMYAANFTIEDMKKAILYCKLRHVKTNLTLNILIENSEFQNAIALVREAYLAGIDAIIVQDLGLAKFLLSHFPNLPIHASTQMSIHNLEGVLQLEKLGFSRVVLARELPLNEIEYICQNSSVEIETFIHGALCISYSGQCLFSSMIGGRSANRGKCAAPCRQSYELIGKENEKESKLQKGYLLSPKDLCGLSSIPELIKAGVSCFKIEGRMKSAEYVATVTRIYRKYIDLAYSGQEYVIAENDIQDLMQVFNRGGFSSGHLDSNPNFDLVFPDKANNMGLYLGSISKFQSAKGYISFETKTPLAIGDSISVEHEDNKYTISELLKNNQNVKEVPANTFVTIGRMKGNINVGDKLYKLANKELSTLAKQSYENSENRKITLHCTVTIKKDIPISIKVFTTNEDYSSVDDCYHDISIEMVSDVIPVVAINAPITVDRVIEQISKTNNTPYQFNTVTVYLDEGLYVPSIKTLNELRRKALEELETKIVEKYQRKLSSTNLAVNFENVNTNTAFSPLVSLSLRQLSTEYDYTLLDKSKINRIYLALKLFVDKKYQNVIKYFCENYDIYIYLPTIIKANYKNILLNSLDEIVQKYNIKGFILSNIADFQFLEKYKGNYDFIGNYSLNVLNSETLKEYQNLGLSCITLSRELNKKEILGILNTSSVSKELIVYGNLPVMATNYCFLGKTNRCFPTCQSSCKNENVKYYLKDRLGYSFRIIPDSLQTVSLIFNSKTLSIPTTDISISHIRADMIDETVEEMNHVLEAISNREKLEGSNYTNGNLNREI